MKKILVSFLVVILLASNLPITGNAAGVKCELYVATNGNDQNDGSFSSPLKTLKAARDKIRLFKNEKAYSGGYTVYVREGSYQMDETFKLEEQDSGTKEAPVTYCAYGNEEVKLVGGVYFTEKELQPAGDTEKLKRLPEEDLRKKIYMLDLKKIGVENLGSAFYRGAYSYNNRLVQAGLVAKPNVPSGELFCNGQAMNIARYPNNGYIKVTSVLEKGYDYDDPDSASVDSSFVIGINDERLSRWTTALEDEALMYGFWKWAWADQTVPIKSIDVNKKQIASEYSSIFGVRTGAEFYVYNLLEELDSPGEYYIDYDNQIIYLYPPESENREFLLTTMASSIVYMKNTRHITFSGIDISGTRKHAFMISGGTNNTICDSEISLTSDCAVVISGYRNGIRDSYIHDVEGGVNITGGEFESLVSGENYAENCEIERFSRLSMTYVPAVSLGGVGNCVSYCEIHDAPHMAIEYGGNNNRIEYNEIYSVLQYADDGGAIYGGLTWVDRGTKINYNYIHDLEVVDTHGVSEGSGIGAIYLDGGQCEISMEGNVLENIDGRAFWINGGRDNVIKNNIIINCTQGLLFSDIMLSIDLSKHHYPKLHQSAYATSCKWKQSFPKLQNLLILSDDDKKLPLGNLFVNNVSYKTELVNATTKWSGEEVPVSKYLNTAENLVTGTDPGFLSIANKNYAFHEQAMVYDKLEGFKNIPFEKMRSITKQAQDVLKNAVVMKIASPKAIVSNQKQLIDAENLKVTPILINGYTYVPVQFVAEALGMAVSSNENTVTINGNGIELTLAKNGTEYTKNGVSGTLQAPAILNENRIMLPVREISALLSKKVVWDESDVVVVCDDEDILIGREEIITYLSNILNKY